MDETSPKKAKTVPSAGKVMASVFWDAAGIIYIDYLQKGRTINGAYYVNQLDQLHTAIQQKRPGIKKKKIYFLQDNAPAHTSKVVMAKLKELRYELVPHPPYSPDLAPSDFFLFPKLKTFLAGPKYGSNTEVISAAEGLLSDLDKSAYSDGIKAFETRLNKCIQLEGEYVEK